MRWVARMPNHTELAFEDAVERAFVKQGYVTASPVSFNPETGLCEGVILDYIQATQPQIWEHHAKLYKDGAGSQLIKNLMTERAHLTILGLLRHGFKSAGKTVRLTTFKPNTNMNPDLTQAYKQNRFTILRQVHFDPGRAGQSIDVVLMLNGVPIVTMELKNPMTGQSFEDGIHQYKKRDASTPLLTFKTGALVHFAIDPNQVWMATHLQGISTRFLPFNQGYDHGAGNPPSSDKGGYAVSYLWEDVLAPDSLLELIGRFLHLEKSTVTRLEGEHQVQETKEVMIFPRYHQRACVRALTSHAFEKGAGHNYLINHSAGSGKSNSIAWLAHRLSSLHDAENKKVFHSVIVITDRRVLDTQLQDTIYQFEHKHGVVEKIDQNTKQLARALSDGTPIIISTIQKFPFINSSIQRLKDKGEEVTIDTTDKRFAVIVDEAHSSQTGEAAKTLRGMLNKSAIEQAVAEQALDDEDDDLSDEAKKTLFREMISRQKQDNLSYFAFTATPKSKTLEIFNEAGPTGMPPFHVYSMKQAIEEGFILDVLKNYTTYKTYFGLVKKEAESEAKVPKKQAAKALARFLTLHSHNLSQKVELITEHFRAHVRHKIGGNAKAMLVTSSRIHAVRYKQAFDKYLAEKSYNNVRALVAFSGQVQDPDLPDVNYTEASMNNGVAESALPAQFAGADYQILIVAEKYQTGFDQPLLAAMYIDKVLGGVHAVQTLSRLNRTMNGKEDTIILDFVNSDEDIHKAFKPYYKVPEQGEVPEPSRLNELQAAMLATGIIRKNEIDAFASIWFSDKRHLTQPAHARLNDALSQACNRYVAEEEGSQLTFSNDLSAFMSLYSFLSQIIPYYDSELEKLFVYGRALLNFLPKEVSKPIDLEDDVSLKYYRLSFLKRHDIALEEGAVVPLKGPVEVGTGKADEEVVILSDLIEKLNERFGTDFTDADEVYFDSVAVTASEKQELRDYAFANALDNFELVFERQFKQLLLERSEKNSAIMSRIEQNSDFYKTMVKELSKRTYNKIRQSVEVRVL